MTRLMRLALMLCFALAIAAKALVAQTTRLCANVMSERPASACFLSVADSLDVRLGALLSQLQRSIPGSEFSRLQRAQELWRASRDSTCVWERDMFSGGSIAPRVEAKCEITLTIERIRMLKLFLCPGAPVMPECTESHRYDILPEP